MSLSGSHRRVISGRASRYCVPGLIALYLCLYLFPLASRPLVRPDEVRYAEISREMIVSGDWVSPHFNGVRYFEKPVMGYWLNSVSLEVFGETPFAIRLPSALAAIFTGLLVLLLTTLSANRRAGLYASGIYLSAFGTLAIGTMALLDSLFTFFISLTIGVYWLALRAASRARSNWLLALSGVGCGGAFLTKGFLAAVLPALVAGAFLVWERRWQELWRTAWIPLAVAVATALPWSIAIALNEPDFWHYFFWVEHVGRFLSDDAQHSAPWWYYLAALPLLAFPWIFLVPQGIAGLRSSGRDPSFVRFLVCWAILPFLFFSVSHGKLATYILPCMVPFAMLLGVGVERGMVRDGRLMIRWASFGLAAVLATAFAVVVVAQRGVFGEIPYTADEWPRFVCLLVALGTGFVMALWAQKAAAASLQLLLVGAAVLPFYFAITIAWPSTAVEDRAPSRFLAEQVGVATDALLVSDSSLFGTVSWALQRSDVYVIGGGEITYGLSYPEDQHRWLDEQGLAGLLETSEAGVDIVIFCEKDTEESIRSVLPPRGSRMEHGDLVLWRIPASAEAPDG